MLKEFTDDLEYAFFNPNEVGNAVDSKYQEEVDACCNALTKRGYVKEVNSLKTADKVRKSSSKTIADGVRVQNAYNREWGGLATIAEELGIQLPRSRDDIEKEIRRTNPLGQSFRVLKADLRALDVALRQLGIVLK